MKIWRHYWRVEPLEQCVSRESFVHDCTEDMILQFLEGVNYPPRVTGVYCFVKMEDAIELAPEAES